MTISQVEIYSCFSHTIQFNFLAVIGLMARGRPWKYGALVASLADDELFHVAKIIRVAEENGFFDHSIDYPDKALDESERKTARRKALNSLAWMARKHLPEPDGKITGDFPYEAVYKAWYGRTWKQLLAFQKEKD